MARNTFDQACRYAARLDPPGVLAWVLDLPPADLAFGGWLDTRGLPFPGEPDRTGDTVARLDHPRGVGVPWALAVEFQIEPDPLMFGRLLSYLAQLWLYAKPDPGRGSRFQVGAAVVNLTGQGNAAREMYWPEAGLVTRLGVAERNLARESADDTLGRIEAGRLSLCVLPWVSLMAGGAGPAVTDRWKRIAATEPDGRARSDYGSLALVFASAAKRRTEWQSALQGWNMTESPVVLEWIEQGVAKGVAQGVAQGVTQGLAAALLTVLEEKCGPVPEDLAAAIRGCADQAQLRRWLGLAVHAETPAAFRATAGV